MPEGIQLGEPDGASPAKSNKDDVRRMPPEPVLGGAVRGRSMRSVGLLGDNVAITWEVVVGREAKRNEGKRWRTRARVQPVTSALAVVT